jgi:methylated-DNA-protein-cysteine methyltransferase related protein
MSTYDRIYEVVRQIPYGKVATYGQIATLANLPGQARLVGYALYRVEQRSDDIPWQRVVNAKGEISYSNQRYGADDQQRSLLEAEGIRFSPVGKIDFREYLWLPEAETVPSHLAEL